MGVAQANMGIALMGFAGTGFFSIYITRLTEENNVLWLQDQPGLFRIDVAKRARDTAGMPTGCSRDQFLRFRS